MLVTMLFLLFHLSKNVKMLYTYFLLLRKCNYIDLLRKLSVNSSPKLCLNTLHPIKKIKYI